MKDTDYKGMNTLIRTYELRLLKTEDFERLLKAKNLSAALDVLNGTDYDFNKEELMREKDFNSFLMNHLVAVYQELFAIAPDPELVELFSLRYTYHNLKVLMKQHLLKENLEYLLIPIGRQSLDQLKHLVEVGMDDDFHPIMSEAVRLAKSDYAETGILETITVYMDTYYFRHLRAISNRIDYEPIKQITDLMIDLYNLTSVVRSLNQKKPRSHLYALLSSAGSITKQEIIDESINGGIAVLTRLYSGKPYSARLEMTIKDNKEIDTLMLDKLMDELIHESVSEGLYQPFGPLPLLGYLYAKETEVRNLRLLLVGKDNAIAEDVLRGRVRQAYGS